MNTTTQTTTKFQTAVAERDAAWTAREIADRIAADNPDCPRLGLDADDADLTWVDACAKVDAMIRATENAHWQAAADAGV